MDNVIQISKLNDFIFCPMSLYFHSVYESFEQKVYHRTPQIIGKLKHEIIDRGLYSTAKKYLQGIEVCSEKYYLIGKIDIYDTENKILIERKTKIKKIYDGYKYQLYAQYFCLKEMGCGVKKMFLYSLLDNKKYRVNIPKAQELKKFEDVIRQIQNFNILQDKIKRNSVKCAQCIYNELCK